MYGVFLEFLFVNDCCPPFCCSTADCLHLYVIVLLCAFGNEVGISQCNGNSMGIGMRFTLLNLGVCLGRNGNCLRGNRMVEINSRSSLYSGCRIPTDVIDSREREKLYTGQLKLEAWGSARSGVIVCYASF